MATPGVKAITCVIASLLLIGSTAWDCGTSDDESCPNSDTAARASMLLQVDRSQVKDIVNVAAHEHLLDSKLDTQSTAFPNLASRVAADGFCVDHPCRVLLQASPMAQNKAGVGKMASLSESGYKRVAAAKDDVEMGAFVQRVIDKYDCKVESEGGLNGIIPWFSGTTLEQSLSTLEETLLFSVLAGTKGNPSWLSLKNSDGVTGDTADLSFVGYVQVAAMKDDAQMKKFVRRVCQDMGVKIVDEGGFVGMVKFYSGTDNFQSFERLQAEVKSAANNPRTWGVWEEPDKHSLAQHESPMKSHKEATGFSLLAVNAPDGFCQGHPCRAAEPSLIETAHEPLRTRHGLGKSAAMDQAGYAQVAAMKDDSEMTDFVLRMVDKYDCRVEEMGGLKGIVPWFSGTTTEQSLEKLESTLLYAVLTYSHPWLTYKNSDGVTGDTAQLNFVGYVQTAALRSDVQMKKFVRRVCQDMKVKIVDEGGFEGMVKYYSGTDNFQSYDGLLSEVKSAANAPHSWAKW